jgi:hypothetical protein
MPTDLSLMPPCHEVSCCFQLVTLSALADKPLEGTCREQHSSNTGCHGAQSPTQNPLFTS